MASKQSTSKSLMADEHDALVLDAISNLDQFVASLATAWHSSENFKSKWEVLQLKLVRDIKTCEQVESDAGLVHLHAQAALLRERTQNLLETFDPLATAAEAPRMEGSFEIGNFLSPKLGSIDLTLTVWMPVFSEFSGFGFSAEVQRGSVIPVFPSFIMDDDYPATKFERVKKDEELPYSLVGGIEEVQSVRLYPESVKFGLLAVPSGAGVLKVITRLKELSQLLSEDRSNRYDALGIITRNASFGPLVREAGFAVFLLPS